MQNSFLRADYRRAMKGSALFLSLLLTACQSVPTRDIVTKPVVLTRTVERYVPIDPGLTFVKGVPKIKRPSDIAEVAALRKKYLLQCYYNLEQIATIQGTVKEPK